MAVSHRRRCSLSRGFSRKVATTWTFPWLIAAVIGVGFRIGAFVASPLVPIRGGVGGPDPLEPTVLLGRLARFCIDAAVVCGLISAALYLVQGGKVWRIAILAAAAVMVARWGWLTGRWEAILEPVTTTARGLSRGGTSACGAAQDRGLLLALLEPSQDDPCLAIPTRRVASANSGRWAPGFETSGRLRFRHHGHMSEDTPASQHGGKHCPSISEPKYGGLRTVRAT